MILHQNILGVDVAKDWIDICDLASGWIAHIETKPRTLKAFAGKLPKDSLVVFEASGGYERPLMAALRGLDDFPSVSRKRVMAFWTRGGTGSSRTRVERKCCADHVDH